MKKQFYIAAVAILAVFSFSIFFLTRFNQSTIITRDGFFVSGEEIDEILLSTNKVAKTANVKLEKVSRNDTFYVNGGRVYVGEEEKTSVNTIFPMFINNGLGIVNMDSNAKLINHKFEFFDTYENFTLTDGKLYNFGDYEQADYEHYILLENANHTYVNILECTINTDNGKTVIPINSIINFNLDYLNYYYYNSSGKLVYKIVDGISYDDVISFEGYNYSYEKLLRSLGKIRDSSDYNPEEEEEFEYIIVPGDGTGTGEGWGDGTGSGGGVSGEYKYIAPKVTCTQFEANVYSVKARLVISDPSRVISGGINFQFFTGDKVYLRKAFVTGGNIEVIGLVPNTKFRIVGNYKYYNEEKKKMEMTFFEQELTTLGVENLAPITLSFNNGVVYPNKIELDELKIVSDIKSETIKGINKAVVIIDGEQYSVPTASLTKIMSGSSVTYTSPAKITSNKVIPYEIKFLDAYSNEIKLVNNTGITRTSKNSPTATIKIISNTVSSVVVNANLKNIDSVNIANYRYKLYDSNGTFIREGDLDSSESVNTVTLRDLDPNSTYSIQIVGDFDNENGQGTMRDQVLGEGKFTTSSLSSLGFFRINANTSEISSDRVVISSVLDIQNVSSILIELLNSLRVVVTDTEGTVVAEQTYSGDELVSIKAGQEFLLPVADLSSVTTYNVEYYSTVKQGSVQEEITVLCSFKSFKTYKRHAEIQIQNEFVTSNMIDFDVRAVDLDGAIESKRVLLTIKDSHGALIGKEYLDLNADFIQLSYTKLEENETYTFTYTAEEYNVGFFNNTYIGDHVLLEKNILTENGISGNIDLLELLRNITGRNLFNINDYDRIRKEGNTGYKEYDLKNNTVMFGAKNGYVTYSYFLPEAYKKNIIIKFKARYNAGSPNNAQVYINNQGVGQNLSYEVAGLTNQWKDYMFNVTMKTNYIGFVINETANQNKKTTVDFKDIEIVYNELSDTLGQEIDNSYHSTGFIFTDPVMKSGDEAVPNWRGNGEVIGNYGDGHARITNMTTGQVLDYTCTKGAQTFTAPVAGAYKVELWGAAGGDNQNPVGSKQNIGSHGGLGAYTSGIIELPRGQELYIYVGEAGKYGGGTNPYGGKPVTFNGGGHAGNSSSGSGGGATDVRLIKAVWNDTESLISRIMVAAGGGGADNAGGTFHGADDGSGGPGGALTSAGAYINGVINSEYRASQSYGFAFGYGQNASNTDTGGAGGGYWGGHATCNNNGGAAGGSSYISGYLGCVAYHLIGQEMDRYTSYVESDKYQGTFNISIQDARNELVDKEWYIRLYRKGEYVEEHKYELTGDFMSEVRKTFAFDKNVNYTAVLAVKVRDRYYELDSVTFATDSEIRGIRTADELVGMHTNGKYIVLNDINMVNVNNGISNYFYGEVDFQGFKLIKNVQGTASRLFEQFRSSAVLKNIVVDYTIDNTASRNWYYGLITYNYGTVDNLMINVLSSTLQPNYIFTLCTYANYGTIQNFVINAQAPMSGIAGDGMLVWSNQGVIRNGYVYGENIYAYHQNVNSRTRKDIGGITGETTNNSRIEAVFSLISVEKNNTLGTGERESIVGNIVGYHGNGYFGNSYSVELPEKTNTNVITQDPNIGKVNAMRSSNLYYVSDRLYTSNHSAKVSKLALYDKTFQNQTLNIYDGFIVDEYVGLGYFPQVKLNDCMPKQEWIELPSVDENDLIDVTSVEEIENNADSAKVILHINNPSAETITKVSISDINKVEILGQENSFGKTELTVLLSQPVAFKSKYYIDTLWIKPAYGSVYTKTYQRNERAINIDLYYPIREFADWKVMVSNVSQNYALMNDLDFKNVAINQYVVNGTFSGKLDGRGHTIRNINITSNNALFNTLTGTIKNLNVENYTKTNKTSYGGFIYSSSGKAMIENVHMNKVRIHARDRIGGMVGSASSTTIRNCSVTDFIPMLYYDTNGVALEASSYEFDNIYVGALAGYTYLSFIENSFAQDVDINISEVLSSLGVGGLVGRMDYGTLSNSYATGKITCNSVNVGGLVGWSTGLVTISGVWSYVDLLTELDYVGGIVGKTDNNQIYNSLVFGAVYSSYVSDSLSDNVHRTSGNASSVVQSNYAWDKQKYYGMVTGESSAEVLLTTEELQEENTYIDLIGFDPYSYDFSQIQDNIVPKLKNSDTGEVFAHQNDVLLESELFDVTLIEIDGTAAYADIHIVFENPQQYEIKEVEFNYLNITSSRVTNFAIDGTTAVDVHVLPERCYDSYILSNIKYVDANGEEQNYEKVVRIKLQFQHFLDSYEKWQQISNKHPENYLLTADIDFRDPNRADPNDNTKMRPNINTEVMFARLEGQLKQNGQPYKLMYYYETGIKTGKQTLIKEITTSLKNVNFENITLIGNSKINYMNIIYLNYGDIDNVQFNNITINNPKASYLAPIGYHRGQNMKNVSADGNNITGVSYLGGIISYMYGTSNQDFTARNCTIYGTGSYIGGIIAYKPHTSNPNSYRYYAYDMDVTGVTYVGGIFGQGGAYTSYIYDSVINGINGGSYIGGVSGYNYMGNDGDHLASGCTVTAASSYVGGLHGRSLNFTKGLVINGTVIQTRTDKSYVGGAEGFQDGYTITNMGVVKTTVTNAGDYTGGIEGRLNSAGVLQYSYASRVTVNGRNYVGGIIGYGNTSRIYQTVVNATVTATGTYAGGVAGYLASIHPTDNSYSALIYRILVANTVVSGYNNVGGFVGKTNGSQLTPAKFYNIVIVANVSTTQQDNASCGAVNGDDTMLYSDEQLTTFKLYRNNKVNNKTLIAYRPNNIAANYLATSTDLNTQSFYTNWGFTTATYDYTDIATYYPRVKSASNGAVATEQLKIETPKNNGAVIYSKMINNVAPVGHELPKLTTYSSGINTVNLEFDKYDEYSYFEVYDGETKIFDSNLTKRTYTINYDYCSNLKVIVKDGRNTKEYKYTAGSLRNLSSTYEKKYVYIYKGKLYGNIGEVKSSGKFIHMYKNFALTDEMEVYDITTREKTKETFKFTISLLDNVKPLFEFDHMDTLIDTFYNYSVIHKGGEDIVYENQLLVKNGAIEVIDSSLDSYHNMVILDNYSNDNYVSVLGKDGSIYDLKTSIKIPANLSNKEILSISNNIYSTSSKVIVIYKTGKVVVFDYRTGEQIIVEKPTEDISIFDYFQQNFSKSGGSLIKNNIEDYEKALNLKELLKDNPIELNSEGTYKVSEGDDELSEDKTPNINIFSNNYITYYNSVRNDYDVLDVGSLLDSKDYSVTKGEDIVTEKNKIYTSNALVEYYMNESIFEKLFRNLNGLYIFAVLAAGIIIALGIGAKNTKLLRSVEEVNNGKN